MTVAALITSNGRMMRCPFAAQAKPTTSGSAVLPSGRRARRELSRRFELCRHLPPMLRSPIHKKPPGMVGGCIDVHKNFGGCRGHVRSAAWWFIPVESSKHQAPPWCRRCLICWWRKGRRYCRSATGSVRSLQLRTTEDEQASPVYRAKSGPVDLGRCQTLVTAI